MDFRSMLTQLGQLSEATKETSTGRVHKAEPGGYGRKFDTDEEGDEKKDEKKAKKDDAPKKRGRPPKTGEHSPEERKKNKEREEAGKKLQSMMVGNLPKGKLPGKASKKHKLKEWIEEIEAKYMAEAAPGQSLTVKPMQGAAQLVDPATNKVVATGKADKIKALQGSMAQGEVQMPGKMEEAEGEKWIQKAIKKPGALKKQLGVPADEKIPAGKLAAAAKKGGKLGQRARLAQTLRKMNEVDQPTMDNMSAMGAGLGAGRNPVTLEAKEDTKALKKDHKAEEKGKKVTKDMEKVAEAVKPDFPDIDDDGNKKEPISKAAKDAENKKKMNESMDRRLKAAHHMGKSHALAKEAYSCKYEDVEEARSYHDGFKEGLDECYGQMPIQGLVGEMNMPSAPATPPATMSGMANQAMPTMEDDMEEGNAFTAALKSTPKGGTFTLGGKKFKDTSNYEESMAFESWENQLSSLLEDKEEVSEGMTVSISKGQQGAPDSVTISAQDSEADNLLNIIKQAGLGIFGGAEKDMTGHMSMHSSHGDDEPAEVGTGGTEIDVVDDNDGMMSLIKKMAHGDHDSHEEHTHEEKCNECGYMESKCQCDEEVIDEVQSEDQMEFEVAEDNPPDSGNAETTADENAEAEEDKALAIKSMNESENLTEWANDMGQTPEEFREETFTADIDFMLNVISSGLNKKKSTGQQTIPVLAGDKERTNIKESSDPLLEWKKLGGVV